MHISYLVISFILSFMLTGCNAPVNDIENQNTVRSFVSKTPKYQLNFMNSRPQAHDDLATQMLIQDHEQHLTSHKEFQERMSYQHKDKK